MCLAEDIAHHLAGSNTAASCQATSPTGPTGQPGQAGGLVSVQDVQAMLIDTTDLTIQPPGGRAVINAPVYYLSGARQQERTVSVLNQAVTIHAWPVAWTWNTGDGTTFTTNQPGTGWPDSPVRHTYRHPGHVTITVTVSWQATYTVNDTTYPIDGNATTSTSTTLDLHQAESILTN